MTALRTLARTIAWTVAGLVAGLALAVAAPLAFDARPYSVLSGSMEPAIAAGDLVVAQRTSALDIELGDVVTFRDPDDGTRLITHRVGGIRREGAHVAFVTKGDANTGTESWRVAAGGEVGRVAYRLPLLGHAAVATRTRIGFALIVVLPLLLLAINELARIWRPTQETQDAARA